MKTWYQTSMARIALITFTVAMVMGSGIGTAQAAAITSKTDILSNDQISAAGVVHNIAYTTVTAATTKCIKLDFTNASANLTGSNANVTVDFSNASGGNQVTAGTIVYDTTAEDVLIPFTGTLDAGRIVSVSVGAVNNGGTAGAFTATVELHSSVDCVTSTTVTDTGNVDYTLKAIGTQQNIAVGSSLQWTLTGNLVHQYAVDPVNNPTDTQANTISVRTNANDYTVRVRNLGNMAGTSNGTQIFNNFGGTDATPAGITGAANSVGFGYNIGSVVGSDKTAYTGGNFAAFTTANPGVDNIVLQQNTPTGNTADSAIITYKVGVDWSVEAGNYQTTTVYNVAPVYQ